MSVKARQRFPKSRKQSVSRIAFKNYAGIVHVQIERQGRLAFVSCDRFHEDCVWVSETVPDTFLAELVKSRVLYSYAPCIVGEISPLHSLIQQGLQ
jgi:hypothetical protein